MTRKMDKRTSQTMVVCAESIHGSCAPPKPPFLAHPTAEYTQVYYVLVMIQNDPVVGIYAPSLLYFCPPYLL